MKQKTWLILAGVLLYTHCFGSAPVQKLTVAVMDLKPVSGLASVEAAMLTDSLAKALGAGGTYKTMGRAKREKTLDKSGFAQNGNCVTSACLTEAGRLLGVQKIVGGVIVKLGAVYAVDLRLMDVKTGKLDRAFSRKYACDSSDLYAAMKEAARELSAGEPPAQKQIETQTADSGMKTTPVTAGAGTVQPGKTAVDSVEIAEAQEIYAGKGEFKAMEKTPEIVKKVAPVYPLMAKKRGSSGKVILYLLVDIDGHVAKADVAKSSGFDDLDKAAVEAARQSIFTPAVAPGGKYVRVWVLYPVTFTLD